MLDDMLCDRLLVGMLILKKATEITMAHETAVKDSNTIQEAN